MPSLSVSNDGALALGAAVRALLRQRSMSQAELARRLSVSAVYITQIVRGRTLPNPDFLQRLASVLEARYADLWNTAYSSALPEGYRLAPVTEAHPEIDVRLAHPAIARLLHAVRAAPADEFRALIHLAERFCRCGTEYPEGPVRQVRT